MSGPREGKSVVINDFEHADTFAHTTIAASAEACRHLLVKTFDSLHGYGEGAEQWARLRDVTGRFNLWASNMGVFAALHASLDYRLRDLDDAKQLTLEHLDNLVDGLGQVIILLDDLKRPSNPAHDAAQKMKALFSSLSTSIDWLHRLANMVRRASISRQNIRASTFPLKDSSGGNVTPILTQLFRHWVLRDFPKISVDLCDRLVSTMLLRRRRILYRRSQQVKLAIYTAQPAPKPAHLTLLAPPDLGEMAEGPSLPSMPSGAARTQYTATTVDPHSFHRIQSKQSRVSEARTIAITSSDKDMIPPPPYVAPDMREFVCPFCCLILPAENARNRSAWDAHVKKDLDPYVCVFFPCAHQGSEDIFSTSANWISHEKTHCMRWYCEMKTHKSDAFASQEEFVVHMKAEHPRKFKDAQLSILAEHSRRPLPRTFNACPLCGDQGVENGNGMEDHIAHHLQHLALLSLPLPDTADDAENAGSTSTSIGTRGEEKLAESRNTVKSHTHQMAPFYDLYPEEDQRESAEDDDIPYLDEPKRSNLAQRWRIVRMHKLQLQNPHQSLTEAEQRKDKVLAGFISRGESLHRPEKTVEQPPAGGRRFLKCSGDDIEVMEYPAHALPEYAILSHTWGQDEVTLQDLVNGTGHEKIGFEKIRFCAARAQQDGLRHIWVDTCCIDKTSSAELSEAINSMFHYYRSARRCYVYLSDFSTSAHPGYGEKHEQLRQSRWFTRGWTLLELLAPASVVFFSTEGNLLGDKLSLEKSIHEITGIPVSALRGSPLADFGVEERFGWAEGRRTTREEDKAYCLLGIFDVNMTLLYGESESQAFMRLKEAIMKIGCDYEYLYTKTKMPTATFDALLRAIGQRIIDRFDKDDTEVLTCDKLAAFYKVSGREDILGNFFSGPTEYYVSYVWQRLGCRHSLQPRTADNDGAWDFDPPGVPALTLGGFVRWQYILVLLDPDKHVPLIIHVVRNWAPLRHPDTGELFATNISATVFPSEPDTEIVAWFETCRHREPSMGPYFSLLCDRAHSSGPVTATGLRDFWSGAEWHMQLKPGGLRASEMAGLNQGFEGRGPASG